MTAWFEWWCRPSPVTRLDDMENYQIEELIPDHLRELEEPKKSSQQVNPLVTRRSKSTTPEETSEPHSRPSQRVARRSPNRKSAAEPVLLSELLQEVPASELAQILEQYEHAVREGIIMATPLAGTRFTRSYRWQGKKIKRRLQDEAILHTSELQQWIEDRQREARLENLRYEGRIETTMERLQAGTDDLRLLAQLRRERLLQTTNDALGAQ